MAQFHVRQYKEVKHIIKRVRHKRQKIWTESVFDEIMVGHFSGSMRHKHKDIRCSKNPKKDKLERKLHQDTSKPINLLKTNDQEILKSKLRNKTQFFSDTIQAGRKKEYIFILT